MSGQGDGSRKRGRTREEKEIEEMMSYLAKIAANLTEIGKTLLTKGDLLEPFSVWKTNFEMKKIVLSWRNKNPDLMCAPYKQFRDDCWAIALSRAISIYLKMKNSEISPPSPLDLCNGVDQQHLTMTGAINDLANAVPFVTNHYVPRMTVHRRPSLTYGTEEEHEHFESCIVRLLAVRPMSVGFDLLPSFRDHEGKGIFIPTEVDCEARLYEIMPKHILLLTGVGVEIHNGEAVEFWELQESRGDNYGDDGGYLRFARHKRLITEVHELSDN